MAARDNKAVLRRYADEVWNEGNLNAIDELFAADFAHHEANLLGGKLHGTQSLKELVTLNRNAFPDLRVTIEDQIAEKDKVAARYTVRGTHRGRLGRFRPSGRQIMVSGLIMARFADNKVADLWVNTDQLSVLQQIGVLPAPEQEGS